MFKKKEKQSGVILLEILLSALIVAVIIASVAILMKQKEDYLKNKSAGAFISDLLKATDKFALDSENQQQIINGFTTNGNFYTVNVQTDLINKGYLPRGFKLEMDPHRIDTGEPQIRILLEDGKKHAFVLYPDSYKVSTKDNNVIASYVYNGFGGVYFTPTSPTNTCGGSSCIRGLLNLWSYDASNTTFMNAFSGHLPTGSDTTAVAYKRVETGNAPYLYRDEVASNLSANTVHTDLNIKKEGSPNGPVSMFFNAIPNSSTGEFEGVALSLTSEDLDSDGNFGDHTLTLEDTRSGTANNMQPTLSANGGIKALSLETISPGVYSHSCSSRTSNVFAVNEDNEFVQCRGGAWVPLSSGAFTSSPSSAVAAIIPVTDGMARFYAVVPLTSSGNPDSSKLPSGISISGSPIGYIE